MRVLYSARIVLHNLVVLINNISTNKSLKSTNNKDGLLVIGGQNPDIFVLFTVLYGNIGPAIVFKICVEAPYSSPSYLGNTNL